MTSAAEKLATWIRANLDSAPTHLKLQKLLFYCYGAAKAFGCEDVERIAFEAWEHGPVNREVWAIYKAFGSKPIDTESPSADVYDAQTERVLSDGLAVYGSLDAWALRQESHTETPWLEARKSGRELDDASIAHHFRAKLAGSHVRAPERLTHAWNFKIDRLPVGHFTSFRALAESVRRARV